MQASVIRDRLPVLLLTLLALVAGACNNATDTTTTAPTTLVPPISSQSFDGTLVQLGSTDYPFTVSASGPVTISLTNVAPLATMGLGVAFGTGDGTECSTISTKNDNAKSGAVALSGIAVAGNYCARVYDSGNIASDGSVTYTVEIDHP